MTSERPPPADPSLLVAQLRALYDGETDAIANAANLAAFVMQTFPALNWAGTYFVRGDDLVLGPFVGKPAVARIARGAGVCGTAWLEARTLVVPDVHAFAGHIACDGASVAEIVVPIFRHDAVVGVFDCDSPERDRFQEADRHALEALVAAYASGSHG